MKKAKKVLRPTKVVQVMGGNGCGKTTLVKLLGATSENWTYLTRDDGVILATVFEDIGWVAIGKYSDELRISGCDTLSSWTYPGIHSVPTIKEAILTTLKEYPGYWILFEGMMISTIRSTFYEFLLDLHSKHKSIEPLFVMLKSEPENCIKRMEASNRKRRKPINVDNITAKYNTVLKNAKSYDPQLVRWIDVDTTPLEAMLGVFLWEVYDAELIDALYDNVSYE